MAPRSGLSSSMRAPCSISSSGHGRIAANGRLVQRRGAALSRAFTSAPCASSSAAIFWIPAVRRQMQRRRARLVGRLARRAVRQQQLRHLEIVLDDRVRQRLDPPSACFARTSAPCAIRNAAISRLPLQAASCRGVAPMAVALVDIGAARDLAPAPRSRSPERTASCRSAAANGGQQKTAGQETRCY